MHLLVLRLLLQDGDLGLQIGGLNVGDEAPLKTRAQTVFNLGQLLRRTIRSNHDLLHVLVQRVEGVEELLLRALFLRDELDVVNQQHIHGAKAVAEAGHAVVAQRGGQLVEKLFRGNIADARHWLAALHFVADGVHQVCLAHTHAAIQKQRIVGARGTLRNGQCRGARKLVAVAHHEGVESVLRIELRSRGPVETGLLRHARGRRRRRSGCGVRGNRSEASILPMRRNRRIFLHGHKAHIVQLEGMNIDSFLNQVAVLVANVLELGRRNTHVKSAACGVTVTRRLQPGFK